MFNLYKVNKVCFSSNSLVTKVKRNKIRFYISLCESRDKNWLCTAFFFIIFVLPYRQFGSITLQPQV
jgi:hypothetical protein